MISDDDDSDCGVEDEDTGFVIEDDDIDLEIIEPRRPEKSYEILKESDIKERLEDDIARVSNVLSISRDASCSLLRHFNWSVNKVNEEWFSDEERVRKAVGLLKKPVVGRVRKSTKITCAICFDSFSQHKMESAACGHLFCKACWEGYIRTSINDGPGCLLMRCPDPSCTAFVGQDVINSLVSNENKEKYFGYLLRSYIEDNKKTKWCPAPGCEYAVIFVGDTENYDVTCCCTYRFCWNCTEEAHRPVDCETVAKWTLKNSSESENTNWLLANSKPCPKCKRPIEKNHGCMHMTCREPCRFSFCWLCLRAWADHGPNMGGFISCNRYEAQKKAGTIDKDELRRQKAKNMVERYAHHFERWASNHSSRQKAISDLQEMQTVKIEQISQTQSQPVPQLKFIIDAWQQIIECRRVLKWTYAYGYYLPEDESAKRQFFEYLQGEAESGLERLHQCAERELEKLPTHFPSSEKFSKFRSKLAGLTSVTRDYFENLVRALENGLADVKIATTSNSLPQPSSITSEQSRFFEDADWGNWSCHVCTYLNEHPITVCRVCNRPR